MVTRTATTDELRSLIGRRVRYRGRELLVVEVLLEEPAVVLREPGGAREIQGNQFDEAGRRVPKTWTIPVYAPGGRELHTLFRELELLD